MKIFNHFTGLLHVCQCNCSSMIWWMFGHMFTCSLCVAVSLYIFMHMWTLFSPSVCLHSGQETFVPPHWAQHQGFCNPFLSFHNFRIKNNHQSNGFCVNKYLSSSFLMHGSDSVSWLSAFKTSFTTDCTHYVCLAKLNL